MIISLINNDLSSGTRRRSWGRLDSIGKSDGVISQIEMRIISVDEGVSEDESWVSNLSWQFHSHDSNNTLRLSILSDFDDVVGWLNDEWAVIDIEGNVGESWDKTAVEVLCGGG